WAMRSPVCRGGLDEIPLAEDRQPIDVLAMAVLAKAETFARGLRAVEVDVVAGGVFHFVEPFGLRGQLLLDEPEGGPEVGRERKNQVVVRFAADGDLHGTHAVLNRLDEADTAFGLASGVG